MMERVTMEGALFRQQIAAIRDWDAYQASLLGEDGRRARAGERRPEKAVDTPGHAIYIRPVSRHSK
ncbi:MAG TPA: hypothetical protein DEB25_02030 [Desulfobulbaceae bacterium]|nr:hypothetical protein [Desulfobulbaceae bacterium]